MTEQSQRDILRQFFSRCVKANFASGRRKLLSRKHRMFVLPAGVFLKHGRIPRSSDKLAVAVQDVPALLQSPPRKFVIFVSHRWLTRKDPDDEHRTKYRRLSEALRAMPSRWHGYSLRDLYLWIDFACVDQDNRILKLVNIDNLPIYVACSDSVFKVDHAEYWGRAWCRLEQYILMLLGKRMLTSTYYIVRENGRLEDQDRGSDVPDPVEGKLTFPRDLAYIRRVKDAAQVMVQSQ